MIVAFIFCFCIVYKYVHSFHIIYKLPFILLYVCIVPIWYQEQGWFRGGVFQYVSWEVVLLSVILPDYVWRVLTIQGALCEARVRFKKPIVILQETFKNHGWTWWIHFWRVAHVRWKLFWWLEDKMRAVFGFQDVAEVIEVGVVDPGSKASDEEKRNYKHAEDG